MLILLRAVSRVAVCTLLLECPSHEIIVRRGTFCCGSWITSEVTQSYCTSWTMSRKHQTVFLKWCHMPIMRQGHLKNRVTDTLVVRTLCLLMYTWNMGDGTHWRLTSSKCIPCWHQTFQQFTHGL